MSCRCGAQVAPGECPICGVLVLAAPVDTPEVRALLAAARDSGLGQRITSADVFVDLSVLIDRTRESLARALTRAEQAEAALLATEAMLVEAQREVEQLKRAAMVPSPIEPPAPPEVDAPPACGSLHPSAVATHRCSLPPGHRGQCYARHEHGTAAWTNLDKPA